VGKYGSACIGEKLSIPIMKELDFFILFLHKYVWELILEPVCSVSGVQIRISGQMSEWQPEICHNKNDNFFLHVLWEQKEAEIDQK
jgi:hypothetical protein